MMAERTPAAVRRSAAGRITMGCPPDLNRLVHGRRDAYSPHTDPGRGLVSCVGVVLQSLPDVTSEVLAETHSNDALYAPSMQGGSSITSDYKERPFHALPALNSFDRPSHHAPGDLGGRSRCVPPSPNYMYVEMKSIGRCPCSSVAAVGLTRIG